MVAFKYSQSVDRAYSTIVREINTVPGQKLLVRSPFFLDSALKTAKGLTRPDSYDCRLSARSTTAGLCLD